MIVVDTNIIAYLYLEGDYTQEAEQLLAHDTQWVAPILWRSEFRNVLSFYVRKKIISKHDAISIVNQAEKQMEGNEFQVVSSNIIELISVSQCSAYDCEFICLARELEIPLITEDKKIVSCFSKEACSLKSFLSKKNN